MFPQLTKSARRAFMAGIDSHSHGFYVEGLGFVDVIAWGDDSDSSNHFVVFRVDENHYQLNGYYDSCAGTMWDSLESIYLVKPIQVVTTKWEKA